MKKYDYDLVVRGSGPSGRRAAIQAAKWGVRVLVVENRAPGGVSVHTGTIPSKTVRETVLNLTGFRERHFYDKEIRPASIGDVFGRVQVTQQREMEVLKNQFSRNGVEYVEGRGSFIDSHNIKAEDASGDAKEVSADKIIIAVGTRCFRPDSIEFDGTYVCDSDQILSVQEIPDSVLVVGAGVIGVEYASILNILGRDVTILDPREEYLEFIDREIIEEFTEILEERGVSFVLGNKLERVLSVEDGKVTLELQDGVVMETGMILYAAGRSGATSELNLDSCGVGVDNRARIPVNPSTFQTSEANIYAVGDVVGFPALASTSMAQGRIAVSHAFGKESFELPKFFPYGIYAVPEISTSGATEEELREKNISYVVGRAKFTETSRGVIMGVERGVLKLIFSTDDQKLLGVHIIGEGAAELVHIGQAVLAFSGGMDYFIENIFNFPTLAETYKVAALNAWNQIN